LIDGLFPGAAGTVGVAFVQSDRPESGEDSGGMRSVVFKGGRERGETRFRAIELAAAIKTCASNKRAASGETAETVTAGASMATSGS
jgi:hypothetical protein